MRIALALLCVAAALAVTMPSLPSKVNFKVLVTKEDDKFQGYSYEVNINGKTFAESLYPTGTTRYVQQGGKQYSIYISADDQENLKCSIGQDLGEGLFGLAHLVQPWTADVSKAQYIGQDYLRGELVFKFVVGPSKAAPYESIFFFDAKSSKLVHWETQHQGHAYRTYSIDVFDWKENYNNDDLWDHSMCYGETLVARQPDRVPPNHADLLADELVSLHEYDGNDVLPKSVDWSQGDDRRTLVGVWDQGQCGSCWAHSAAEGLYGQILRYSKTGHPISRQWINDCSTAGQGCYGGDELEAYRIMAHNKDIVPLERAYPYNINNNKCRAVTANPAIAYGTNAKPLVTGVKVIPEGNEDALKHAIATVGPVTIGVCVNEDFMNSHDRVIHTAQKCTAADIEHAILAIGYGVDDVTGEEYWLVQNSWSYRWNWDGKAKIARNRGNQFAIASGAGYPVVDPEVAKQF
ncbi:Papain family cysteine protease [Carpediemonas membranifera]|uniref:Papain family cysteine protease n=1 Tax=Carpediemonas membranifera TaxID=201153 RepID=A0A8J6BZ46_9EUKA|nr:Papain family cysteine protease [Carpediemonas membranifera]|eukprot:KAG9395181.1 Papain family cysteine protease [Carpediemonas membranifera]